MRALAVALAATAGVAAHGADRLAPYAGSHYVNPALGFMVALPPGMAACQLPEERWREGVVLLPGVGASCAATGRLVALIAVSGEPNGDAVGDVESLAAGVCADAGGGAAPVLPARRPIAGLPTLMCILQSDSGSMTIEVIAQRASAKPAATWTNLRVTLHVRGDRWLEYTRALDDVVGRVGLLPP